MSAMETALVSWKRLDLMGHDACRLQQVDGGWRLSGVALYHEDALTALSYDVLHDANWVTRSARISGWVGSRDLELSVERDAAGLWWFNGDSCDGLADCVDLDLGFTPATNTNVIRRLKPGVGDALKVMIAWIDTSDWQLKPLEQHYQLLSDGTYDYGAPALDFRSTLTVDQHGLVTEYGGLWSSA